MPKRTMAIALLLTYCLVLPILFSMTFDWLEAYAGDDSAAPTDVWGDPHVGLVVDTTASMGPELSAIAAAWQAQSQNRPLPGTYHLAAFRDEAAYLGNTGDPVTFYNWLNALEASGGDECPDNALAGLINMASNLPQSVITPTSEVLLFTDVGPHRQAHRLCVRGQSPAQARRAGPHLEQRLVPRRAAQRKRAGLPDYG